MHGPYRSHYKTWQHLKAPARAMRHEPTPAESILWETVRDRRLSGYKFRRQYTIGRFIVDFVCLERKLIIEVDGEIHQLQVGEDQVRQGYVESQGFKTLRFANASVINDLAAVEEQIRQHLECPA